MCKNLIERIIEKRELIDSLTREMNAIKNKIVFEKSVLEDLEKLTVNQLDIFADGDKEEN